MKQFKGTKGKWSIREVIGYGPIISSNEGTVCDTFMSSFDNEEIIANAKLIAAAPDMLEALIDIKRSIEFLEGYVPTHITNAINKALGE